MDAGKTGGLIAQARKEKNMTQKQLAEALHISDRTVSKWERGAGFPDVSLLEPLADALGLSVASLLRGEVVESVEDVDVRLAVRSIRQVMLGKLRKNLVSILGWAILLGILYLIVFHAFQYNGLFAKEIQHELTAGVYINGERVADTKVAIQGTRMNFGRGDFNGRFCIEYVEKTCRDNAAAVIGWHDDLVFMSWFGPFIETTGYIYMSPTMDSFAIEFADGVIIATSDSLAELIALEWYYPLTTNSTYRFR